MSTVDSACCDPSQQAWWAVQTQLEGSPSTHWGVWKKCSLLGILIHSICVLMEFNWWGLRMKEKNISLFIWSEIEVLFSFYLKDRCFSIQRWFAIAKCNRQSWASLKKKARTPTGAPTWTIIMHCCSGCVSRELDLKQSSLGLNWHLHIGCKYSKGWLNSVCHKIFLFYFCRKDIDNANAHRIKVACLALGKTQCILSI